LPSSGFAPTNATSSGTAPNPRATPLRLSGSRPFHHGSSNARHPPLTIRQFCVERIKRRAGGPVMRPTSCSFRRVSIHALLTDPICTLGCPPLWDISQIALLTWEEVGFSLGQNGTEWKVQSEVCRAPSHWGVSFEIGCFRKGGCQLSTTCFSDLLTVEDLLYRFAVRPALT